MTRCAAVFFLVCAGSLAPLAAALAQEQGNTGITMGYPASFGFIYHVTDRVAVRPEVVFSRSTSEVEQAIGDRESTNWAVGVGVSGLFYLGEWDRVKTYICPRYAYTRGESNVVSTFLFDDTTTTTTDTHLFSGSFGAQYTPHPRFSIFGEIGLGYSTTSTESTIIAARAKGSGLGTRTGAGIIFYF